MRFTITNVGAIGTRLSGEWVCAVAQITGRVRGERGRVELHLHTSHHQVWVHAFWIVTVEVSPGLLGHIFALEGQEKLAEVEVQIPARVARVHIDR